MGLEESKIKKSFSETDSEYFKFGINYCKILILVLIFLQNISASIMD